MPFTPTDPTTVFPDNVNPEKDDIVAKFEEIDARLGNLLDDASAVCPGELVVNGDAGTGPEFASDGGEEPISCAGRAFGYYKPDVVLTSGAFPLTDFAHSGRLLVKRDAEATTLYLDESPDPQTGVSLWFSCSIWRQSGAGDVQIVSSLTNDNPSGHTRVSAGGAATVAVDTETGIWTMFGATEV